MYITYEEYQAFGGTLPEADFIRVEPHAEAIIRYLTYVRGDIFATPDDTVKKAVCVATDTVNEVNQARATLKSESLDGYSVTFATEGQDSRTKEEFTRHKVLEAVRVYLLPTGWLSRSLGRCGRVHANVNCAL